MQHNSELRQELRDSEEQCSSLRTSIMRAEDQQAKTAQRLREKLDEARSALQRSLQEASEAQDAEVSRLHTEIQQERQRGDDTELAEGLCEGRISALRQEAAQLAD